MHSRKKSGILCPLVKLSFLVESARGALSGRIRSKPSDGASLFLRCNTRYDDDGGPSEVGVTASAAAAAAAAAATAASPLPITDFFDCLSSFSQDLARPSNLNERAVLLRRWSVATVA